MQLGGMTVPVGGVENRTLPGPGGALHIRIYSPKDCAVLPLPGLVFFHGGGFVAGSLETHDDLCRVLTVAACCRVVSVDYRLAPEHTFPAAVEDACAATAAVAGNAQALGIDANRIAVGGDSAGGTLAAVVCQWAHDLGSLHIAAQLLLCPILEFAQEFPSRQTFAEGYLLDRVTIRHDLAQYLGDVADPADPQVSPLRAANLAGVPPTLIHTAEFDPFRDEGAAYAARLGEAKVAVQHTCHLGMIHGFYAMGGIISYARLTLEAIGKQLRHALTEGDS